MITIFDALKNRYIITGKISFKGPVAVSTGEADENTDAPVMKRKHDKVPFIPGSSFRGALRAAVERILAGLGVPACLLGANPLGDKCLSVSKDAQKEVRTLTEKPDKTEVDVLEAVLEKLCPACGLFGSTFLASRLKVADLIGDDTAKENVVIRHRVGIDRDSETARDGAKFDGEMVEKGKFEMELILENGGPQDWGMLGLGLLELQRNDLWVGGDNSVGAGRCKLHNFAIKYFGENGYGLKNFLVSGSYKTKDNPWDFVQGHVNEFLAKSEGVVSYKDLCLQYGVGVPEGSEDRKSVV